MFTILAGYRRDRFQIINIVSAEQSHEESFAAQARQCGKS